MSGSVGDSLPAPDAETAGPPHIDRAGLVRAYRAARAAGDLDGMTAAAMGLAARQPFGTYAGRIPAFLHEAYALARGEQRARLAVAIARAWAYGGDPERAAGFAEEALAAAEKSEDPSLLVAALDVQLLVHWGPDAFDQRIRLTARLENTVAHLVDVEARLSAHLWRLTTALECLDPLTALRQLRALNVLAEESGSPRIRFFARSRQAMYALVSGHLDEAERAMREAVSAGMEAGEVDAYAIERTLTAGIARQADDIETLAREAASHEDFGVREGVVSIAAEGASLWLVVMDVSSSGVRPLGLLARGWPVV